MANFNKCIFVGRMTNEPTLRYSNSGVAIGGFRLAVNRKYKDRELVTFIPVVTWNKLAEIVKEHQHKGSEVLVEGELRTNSWEDEKTGAKRSRLEVHANTVEFLGPPRKKTEETPAPPPSEDEIPI